MALLLAQARNVPQAHAALDRRAVGALPVGGRRAGRQDARHHRPRAHRQARGPAGARLRHAAHRVRPVRRARPGPPARRRAGRPRTARRHGRLRHHPRRQDEGDRRPRRQGPAGQGQARHPHRQRRPGRHRRRGRAGRGDPRGPRRRRRARRVRRGADARRRRSSSSTTWSSRPTSGRSTREAQDKAGDTIAEQVALALAGDFVPFAVNVSRGRGVARRSGRSCRWPSGSAGCSSPSTRACRRCSRSSTRASWPTTTPASSRCRCSRACSAA